jgi:hypothetical protein
VSYDISLTPEAFTLVKFDAAELLAIAQTAADNVGVPTNIKIDIEVDEALPHPLVASASEVGDGTMSLWFSGGSFEDSKHQAILTPEGSLLELASAFLRGRDRMDGGFEDAPADGNISERQRVIWDTYTEGRLNRQGGYLINEPRRRYTYRLRCGFSDVADAEYERLWKAESLSWAELEEIEGRLVAADPRPAARKPLRNETLRIS